MKIRITESQYNILVNKPKDVVFGVLLEYEKPKGTSEGDDENISEIIKYISQYNTFKDFKESPKYSAIKNYIYRFYNKDENYNWKQITSNLQKDAPNKLDDNIWTDRLIKQFPQWNFTNVNYYFKNDLRYLNGLYCPIKDDNGEPHGVSNDIDVKGLLRRGSGCRKCALYRIKNGKKINIEKWIEDFPKDKNLIFDPNKFYYRDDLSGKPLFVKDVICTKHNPPYLFAQNGVNTHNLKKGTTGCPICGKKESMGEKMIKQILEQMGFTNIPEIGKHIINDCRNSLSCRQYKFDIFLPYNKNNYKINKNIPQSGIIFEYDGIQHFQPVERFGGEEKFRKQIHNDKEKNLFCKNNNIKLVRIPYTSKTKEDITRDIESALKDSSTFVLTGDYPKSGWNK
jgi:hypothetical protein